MTSTLYTSLADEPSDSLESEPVVEDAVEESVADAEVEGRFAREVIIDDSGIVIVDGDDEYVLDDEGYFSDEYESDSRFSVELEDEEDVIFGRDVVIEEDEVIHNDMIIINGDLDVYGRVIGDLVILVGDITLYDGSEVTGDVLCVGGGVVVEPGADAFGEITSLGDDFYSIFGSNGWDGPPFRPFFPLWAIQSTRTTKNLLVMLLLTLVGYLMLVRRIPNFASTLRYHPWRSLLVGFLSLIIGILLLVPAVLLIVLLAFTVVGIPISLLAVLAIIGFSFLAVIIPIYTFSYYSFEMRGMNRYLSVSIWVGIFWLLSLMGTLTGLLFAVQCIFFMVGLGVMVITRLGARETTVA